MDPALRDSRVGDGVDLPAVRPRELEELHRVSAARVGNRRRRLERGEEREDRRRIPLLVEHVGGEDESEGAPRGEGATVPPVGRHGVEPDAVPRRVSGEQPDGVG